MRTLLISRLKEAVPYTKASESGKFARRCGLNSSSDDPKCNYISESQPGWTQHIGEENIPLASRAQSPLGRFSVVCCVGTHLDNNGGKISLYCCSFCVPLLSFRRRMWATPSNRQHTPERWPRTQRQIDGIDVMCCSTYHAVSLLSTPLFPSTNPRIHTHPGGCTHRLLSGCGVCYAADRFFSCMFRRRKSLFSRDWSLPSEAKRKETGVCGEFATFLAPSLSTNLHASVPPPTLSTRQYVGKCRQKNGDARWARGPGRCTFQNKCIAGATLQEEKQNTEPINDACGYRETPDCSSKTPRRGRRSCAVWGIVLKRG